jgi:hypothetical protein
MILKSFDIGYDSGWLFTFADLPVRHGYYQDVMTAAGFGLLYSDPNGKINPDRYATRGDILNFLNSTLFLMDIPLNPHDAGSLAEYADYESVAPADAIIAASFAGDGIITGKSGMLGLKDRASKAEAAVIIYRTLKKYR